jgi:putative transposase
VEIVNKSTNKKLIAKCINMNCKNIYYKSKLEVKDQILINQIKEVHKIHKSYGYIRVSMELKINKKRAQRVMSKYNIRPPRRKLRFFTTKSVSQTSYTNLIKGLEIKKPYEVLCTDLTYIKFQGKFIYLGTVQDVVTREILAANLSDKHDSKLALNIIKEAIAKTNCATEIIHSDQGSEFMAHSVTSFVESNNAKVSVSDKGSPWQNGYKESFFSRFKDENGDLNRFETLGELAEEIYSYINYYNKYRIHTKLKMTPVQFKAKLADSCLEKWGC